MITCSRLTRNSVQCMVMYEEGSTCPMAEFHRQPAGILHTTQTETPVQIRVVDGSRIPNNSIAAPVADRDRCSQPDVCNYAVCDNSQHGGPTSTERSIVRDLESWVYTQHARHRAMEQMYRRASEHHVHWVPSEESITHEGRGMRADLTIQDEAF